MNAEPTKPTVARVRAIAGQSTTFEVQSFTNPSVWYQCELQAHGNAGQCSCKSWETRGWVLIRDTHNLPPSKRCKHHRAAIEAYFQSKLKQEPKYE